MMDVRKMVLLDLMIFMERRVAFDSYLFDLIFHLQESTNGFAFWRLEIMNIIELCSKNVFQQKGMLVLCRGS